MRAAWRAVRAAWRAARRAAGGAAGGGRRGGMIHGRSMLRPYGIRNAMPLLPGSAAPRNAPVSWSISITLTRLIAPWLCGIRTTG